MATVPASLPGCQPNENALWDVDTKYQLETIETVCNELGMQFIMFIGNPAAHTLAYWNGIAKRIWENWAQKDVYRKYGYGDDRPMLVVFYMGENSGKCTTPRRTTRKTTWLNSGSAPGQAQLPDGFRRFGRMGLPQPLFEFG